MRYLCVIFAFVAIMLCGCADSEKNFSFGSGENSQSISIKVVDQTGRPYVTVPITLTSATSNSELPATTDINGDVIFPDIFSGEYTVTLLNSKSMTGKVNILASQTNYTVEIDRPEVSGVLFNIMQGKEVVVDFERIMLIPCNEEPTELNSYYLEMNEQNLFYPVSEEKFKSVGKSLAKYEAEPCNVPAGNYYIVAFMFYDFKALDTVNYYYSGVISITPESIFKMDVTLWPAVVSVQMIIVDENDEEYKYNSLIRFENLDTGNVYYLPLGYSYGVPEAGNYSISIPGMSSDVHNLTLTAGKEKIEEPIVFTRSKIDSSIVSFKILKEDGSALLPEDLNGKSLYLVKDGGPKAVYTIFKIGDILLKYNNETKLWQTNEAVQLPASQYYIESTNDGFYSQSFKIRNDSKYPITIRRTPIG